MAGADLLVVGELFFTLAVAGAIAGRLGFSVIPLYVVSGIVAGPAVAGRLGLPPVPTSETLTLLAELGIVLLLFFLGLEFSIDRLLAARRQITGAGALDLAVNFPVGVGLGLLFGWSLLEALLLGGIVYISSSALITKSLIDLGWIADPESEPILGVLVFEDLAIAVYLALMASLVQGGGDLVGTATDIGIAVGFLLALFVVVYYGVVFFERVLAGSSGEQLVLRVLGIAVPVAGAALALGVSEAVAAFFVGMGFSTTEHVERIERLVSPLRDAFAAIFFFWIGASTDPLLLVGVAVPLAVAVVVTTPTKVFSGYYAGRVYDLSPHRSLRAGVGLVTRGEFSLIIAAAAAAGTGRVMTEVIPAFAVGYVLAMSVIGATLMQYSDAVERVVFRRSAGGEEAAGS